MLTVLGSPKTLCDGSTRREMLMAGGLSWWIVLSNLIGRIRHKLDLHRLKLINMMAGLLLAIFAAVLIGEVVLKGLHVI